MSETNELPEVPNTFKLKGETDDQWLDRITGAYAAPHPAPSEPVAQELAGHFLEDFGGTKGDWQQCKKPIPGMTQPLYKAAPAVAQPLTFALEQSLRREIDDLRATAAAHLSELDAIKAVSVAQPLTHQQVEALYCQPRGQCVVPRDEWDAFARFEAAVRATERACAAAWGVKLADTTGAKEEA